MKEILQLTCGILRNNFFYSDESIEVFLDVFTEEIGEELEFFACNAAPDVLEKLQENKMARLHFTCYFVSVHLRDIFIHRLHFTEQEIRAFESILPKQTGEKRHETQSRHERTYYRKFFK